LARVTPTVFPISAGFRPGSFVCTSATRSARNGATRNIGVRAIARQRSTESRDAANGMILTVAAMWPGATGSKAATVDSVIDSSIALKAFTASASTTRRPARSG